MTTKTATGLPPEILDQMPPNDLDAEMGVIGSIVLDPRLCDDVSLEVMADEFYSDANRKLYGHILNMHNAGDKIDPVLLARSLKDHADWEAVGGAAYLATIMDSVPVAAHAVHYARIVRKKAILRSLIHAGTDILRTAYDPTVEPGELLTRAERIVFSVGDKQRDNRLHKIHDVLMDAMEQIDAAASGHVSQGIATGFVDLDNLVGGLRDAELIILAARPSMGKTALGLNIVDYVACECNVATLFVSLEMDAPAIAIRLLAARAQVDGHKITGGYLAAESREKIVQASAKQSLAMLLIDDTPERKVSEIAAVARRLKRQEGLGLIVIDYLQLIEPDDRRMARHEQIEVISGRLKGLAKELSVPVLCLAQLNRQVEASENNRPKLSHLRSSGAIEQDADVVMFLHREEYFLTGEKADKVRGEANVIVKKHRNGPTGEIKLTWRAQFTRFENRAQQELF